MKLATLNQGGRDGQLVIVDSSLSRFLPATSVAPTLQSALERWHACEPDLRELSARLEGDPGAGEPFEVKRFAAPLPRAYQWLDGSAYLTHVERVRKARGAEMPESFLEDPLMYQGGSDHFLAPTAPIVVEDEAWGLDFESEVAVITDDVPQGVRIEDAGAHILLIVLVNDVSLRNLIPDELAKGFGFLHGKPPSALSPVAVTPDELGDAWLDCKVHLPLRTFLNGLLFGQPGAGADMQFSFADLMHHAAKTRPLGAGTLIGSGTVSNHGSAAGYSCLAEKRVVEIVRAGEATTPFLRAGDWVRIEMLDAHRRTIFGAIEQTVQAWEARHG